MNELPLLSKNATTPILQTCLPSGTAVWTHSGRVIEQLQRQTFTCPAFSTFIADVLICMIHQLRRTKGTSECK